MEKLKKLKNRLKAQPSFTIMEFIKIRNIFVKKKIFEFPVYLFDNKSITFFDVFSMKATNNNNNMLLAFIIERIFQYPKDVGRRARTHSSMRFQ